MPSIIRITVIPILVTLFLASVTLGQTRIITGKIIDTSLDPFYHIFFTYADTTVSAKADSSGNFKFEVPVGLKSLQFFQVSYEEKIINLSSDCNHLEIIMLHGGSYDFMTPGKVDRERKKYFNTIPKRRMEAYEKGIFKMPTGCYEDIFVPHKKELKAIHRRRIEMSDN